MSGLIRNGDFRAVAEGWRLTAGKMHVADRRCLIVASPPDQAILEQCDPIILRAGETYVMSFEAYAHETATIVIQLRSSSSAESHFTTEVQLGTGSMQRYDFTFLMSKPTDLLVRWQVTLKAQSSTTFMHLANVRLHEGGRLVFVGPAGGKSTLCKQHPTAVFDAENVMDFALWSLARRNLYMGPSPMSEQTVDLTSMFFDASVPIILLGLKTGRLAVSSMVGPQNVAYIHWLTRGLREIYSLASLRLEDRVLEQRSAERTGKYLGPLQWNHREYLHTRETHILLHCLAHDHNLPFVDSGCLTAIPTQMPLPPLSALPQSRLHYFSWQETDIRKNVLRDHCAIEVLPHHYAELIDGEPRCLYVVDLFNSTRDEIIFVCQKNTRYCSDRHGSCTVQLRIEAGGNKIRRCQAPYDGAHATWCNMSANFDLDWLPTHRLRLPPPKSPTKCCVLGYYGSFAPLHRGHLETIQLARDHAERALGYHMLGAYVGPLPFVGRSKKDMIDTYMPWRHRAAMAEFTIHELPWVMLDPMCFDWDNGYSTHSMHTLVERLRKYEPSLASTSIDVLWVNGTDIFFPHDVTNDTLKERNIRLLLVPRAGIPQPSLPASEYVLVAPAVQQLDYSSTKTREFVATGRFTDAAEIIGNCAALAYLMWLRHEHDKPKQEPLEPLDKPARPSPAPLPEGESESGCVLM